MLLKRLYCVYKKLKVAREENDDDDDDDDAHCCDSTRRRRRISLQSYPKKKKSLSSHLSVFLSFFRTKELCVLVIIILL